MKGFRGIIFAGLLFFTGCLGGGRSTTSSMALEAGTVSGGGGYADRNGLSVLTIVSAQFAAQLRGTPASLLQASSIPAGWTGEKIAEVVESVQALPNVSRSRDGQDLIFDYNADANHPSIMALAPFFTVYGSVPDGQQPDLATRRDIEHKLIHEVSHLWGLDEAQANQLETDFFTNFDRDLVLCDFQMNVAGVMNTASLVAHLTIPDYSYFLGNESSAFAEGVAGADYPTGGSYRYVLSAVSGGVAYDGTSGPGGPENQFTVHFDGTATANITMPGLGPVTATQVGACQFNFPR